MRARLDSGITLPKDKRALPAPPLPLQVRRPQQAVNGIYIGPSS